MEINFKGSLITLSSEYVGTATPWEDGYVRDYHVVTVSVNDTIFEFDYYCGVSDLDDLELVNALFCFLSDAITYLDYSDIDEFQSEFGYEKVSQCLKVFNGCKKSYEDWEKTGLPLCEMAGYLQETYNI